MSDTVLLQIAKMAILSQFSNEQVLDKDRILNDYPYLKEDAATFVTLTSNNDLRGCIGSIAAYRSLYDDLVGNAVSAAFSDPRFNSLNEDELSLINLEVSVLSEAKIIEYDDYDDLCAKIHPFVDGLILRHGRYQGTFLPQVWEQLPSPQLFLEHLSMKAGSDLSIYQEHPSIYRYGVKKIKNKFDEIQLL